MNYRYEHMGDHIHEGKLNDPYACDGDYYAVAYIDCALY